MNQYSMNEQLGSLAFVYGLVGLAGICFGLLIGFTFPPIFCFKGYRLKPFMSKFQIPPLVAMIITGFVTRNFGGEISNSFPKKIAAWLCNCVVAVLLSRGGMAISFKGKGLLVILIIIIPQLIESTTVALLAHGLFGMPMSIAYALGFCMATVGGSLVVPVMLSLAERGFGKDHGVPATLISCCTFENIDAIIIFGICKAIAFSEAEA